MNTTKKTLLAVLALALALPALPAAAQADFTKFVAIGASVDAGITNYCYVKYAQHDSWPAILARQAGSPAFEQPLFDTPGTGCLYLESLAPVIKTGPVVAKPLNLTLARPYDNMSIAGYKTGDAVTKKGAAGPTDIDGLILRTFNATQVEQAALLKPTFLSIGVYGNDSLSGVLAGTVIDAVTVVPKALYAANYQKIVDTMKASQGGTGKGVVQLIPDVTTAPFASTVPPFITSGGQVVNGPDGKPLTFLSSKGGSIVGGGAGLAPIPPTSLLTLSAAGYLAVGYGIPCAVLDAGGVPANDPRRLNCNKPLPDNCDLSGGAATCGARPGVVLYPDEVALASSRTAEYNVEIQRIATAAGYKVFDTVTFYKSLKSPGRTYGGMTVTTAFLSGGITSYDGFHLTSLGYAIWADEMVQFINASYGTNIPRVNMSTYLFNGNTSTGGFPPGVPAMIGQPISSDELVAWAAAIFTPENTQQFLSMFPATFQSGVAAPDPEEAPIPAERSGHRAKVTD